MAKSLDDLVNFLIDEIALDSERGESELPVQVGCGKRNQFLGFRSDGSVVERLLHHLITLTLVAQNDLFLIPHALSIIICSLMLLNA